MKGKLEYKCKRCGQKVVCDIVLPDITWNIRKTIEILNEEIELQWKVDLFKIHICSDGIGIAELVGAKETEE